YLDNLQLTTLNTTNATNQTDSCYLAGRNITLGIAATAFTMSFLNRIGKYLSGDRNCNGSVQRAKDNPQLPNPESSCV
ncbi:hypothetical protein OS493_039895, partial [Desmophyllum pertusum]